MKAKPIFPIISIGVTIATCFLLAQCYTTLRHPILYSVADSLAAPQPQEVTFMDDCSSCHNQTHPLIHSPVAFRGEPMTDHDYSWQYFYTMPWWLDSYYYEDSPADLENPLPPTERRNFDRREVPSSSAVESPAGGTPALSKPASDVPSPAAPPPPPPQRHERRQISTGESNKVERPATPPIQEKKQSDNPKKKEKE